MKYLFLALITFSTLASNFIPVSTIQNNTKAGYSLLADCQRASAPDEICQDIGDQPLETYEVYTYEVDDESKPIYLAKQQIELCTNIADCNFKFLTFACLDESHFAVKNFDTLEIYCTKRIGFEKKSMKSIRQSQSLLNAYNTQKTIKLANELQEQRLQEKLKLIDAGKRVIALLNLRNESKNLTTAQVAQLITTFASIKSVLETGSLLTAKGLISQVIPDGIIITDADKSALIAELDKFIK